MTKSEIHEIDIEVDRIDAEMDWRDPNLEWQWFEWADARLGYLIETLEASHKQSKIRESGLRLIRGAS